MSWAHYLLQVNIYLVIFYCFYKLLLDKETYFILNRLYLGLSGILSLAIPFLRIEMFSEKVVSETLYISVSEINAVVSNYAILPQTQEQYDWGRLVVIIYIIGALMFLLHFAYQLFAINQLLNRTENNDAFSFLNRKSVADGLPERATVDLHEDIHIKQLHTIDVIFFELLGIITWFNPVIYFYKKSIKNIHEYLADEIAAAYQGDKETYSLLLLSHAFGVKPNSLTNGFVTKSLIKKRIYMLHKQRSKKTAILKYGLFVPLFALTLVLSSATIRKNHQIWAVAQKIPLNQLSDVVGRAIDVPLSEAILNPPPTPVESKPTQPHEQKITFEKLVATSDNNENVVSWNSLYSYLGSTIKYPSSAVKGKLQGNVIVNFTINKGRIMEISSQNELGEGCDEEVINAIATYDDFFGKDGKYSLKVLFKLDGLESEFRNSTAKSAEDYQELQSISIMAYAPKEETVDKSVYNFTSINKPPTYPGGMTKFYEFLSKSIIYPSLAADNEIQGNVFISFVVEKDGSLTEVKVDRKLGFGTDEEAVRVLKLSKKWNPGIQNGKVVRVKYNIPIKFSMNGNDDTPSKKNVVASIRLKSYADSKDAPLIVIDSEIKDPSILNGLDNKTIASVAVVKPTEATSLYGKKAENGAIIITTKKAVKPSVTLLNRN